MLSPLWGLLKDLHLLLPSVLGEHEGTIVCKMQTSTRALATLFAVLLVAEQPFLGHGLRLEHVGGGVQSDDGGFSVKLRIVDALLVPSARVIRGEVFKALSRCASKVRPVFYILPGRRYPSPDLRSTPKFKAFGVVGDPTP